MRIAPRPRPGLEVRLDDLLNPPQFQQPPWIDDVQTGDYYVLYGVQTIAGRFNILLDKHTDCGEDQDRFFEKSADPNHMRRPPCAYEFYAIAQYLHEGLQKPWGLVKDGMSQKKNFEQAYEFFKKIWETGMTLFTQIEYTSELDTIIHHPKTWQETRSQKDLKFRMSPDDLSAAGISQEVFGAPDFNTLDNLWKTYFQWSPMLERIADPISEPKTGGVWVSKETIDVMLETPPDGSHSIFIQRLGLTP